MDTKYLNASKETQRAIAALARVADIWEDRLYSGWTPPAASPFPWVQTRFSLVSLLPGMRAVEAWVRKALTPPAPSLASERGGATEEGAFTVSPTAEGASAPPLSLAREGAGGVRATIVLAGNTPLLSWSPLCACLLAGAVRIRVKLSRDETVWTTLFVETLREADAELADRIELYDFPGTDERTYALLQDTDAVIAYGSDASVAALRERTPPGVAFFGYGHAVSMTLYDHTQKDQYAEVARDVLTFDQQGCLSPHIVYEMAHKGSLALHWNDRLAHRLTRFFQKYVNEWMIPPVTNPEIAREVRETRAMALFAGNHVLGDDYLRWTIIAAQQPIEYPAPVGHGTLYISPVENANQLRELLAPVHGILSCAGTTGELSEEWKTVLVEAGISRVCPVGTMQRPPLDWPNGNQDLLAQLLRLWDDCHMRDK